MSNAAMMTQIEPARNAATPALSVRHPLMWLLIVLAVGLGLRLLKLNNPLELDEFPPLYAGSERHSDSPDLTPAAAEPLKPVASLQEVRERSVLPYGIVQPVPVYHYFLYFVARTFPVSEWALRLPSLVAGLACIAGIFFLCRRALGDEVALVAALLAAVDPIQVTVSTQARPYALGNLACLLSFAALLGLRNARTSTNTLMNALGYGLATAFIGYMNPALLLVFVAHVALAGFNFVHPAPGGRRNSALAGWLTGCVVAVLFLLPLVGYVREVGNFSLKHRDFLFLFGEVRVLNVLIHNSTFLVGLLVASVASYVVRQIQQQETTTAPAGEQPATPPAPVGAPPPDSPELLWLGRAWLFYPQMVALVLAFSLGQALYLSRYLSYTTLAGAILLAYWATRERVRDMRLGVSAAVVLTVLLWGRTTWPVAGGLVSPVPAQLTMEQIDMLEAERVENDEVRPASWKPNDVLLVRSGFLEADFLPDELPAETRRHVHGVLLSPYTTLYVSKHAHPIIVLSKSQFRNKDLHTVAGEKYDAAKRYNPALAEQLSRYNQFWIASNNDGDRNEFMACFLPWLADSLGTDLTVARARPEKKERYFEVLAGSGESDYLEGLSNAEKKDFRHLVRVQRFRPRWVYRLSAVADVSPFGGMPALTATAWRFAQEQTPRVTQAPADNEPER